MKKTSKYGIVKILLRRYFITSMFLLSFFVFCGPSNYLVVGSLRIFSF